MDNEDTGEKGKRKEALEEIRELTKTFETIYRGTVGEAIEKIKKDPLKGEFVAVLEGKK